MGYIKAENYAVALTELYRPVQDELELVRKRIDEHLCSIDKSFTEELLPFYTGIDRRLRAALIFLSSRMFGSIKPECIETATIIEMMYLGSLFHDHIQHDSSNDTLTLGEYPLLHNTAFILLGDFIGFWDFILS